MRWSLEINLTVEDETRFKMSVWTWKVIMTIKSEMEPLAGNLQHVLQQKFEIFWSKCFKI